MVKYSQYNNNYLLQFYDERIDIVTIKMLKIPQGFSNINTKSVLYPNHLCYYFITNNPNIRDFLVLPVVMNHGEIRFEVYCPDEVLLLANTPIASIYPTVSAYDKILFQRVDTVFSNI